MIAAKYISLAVFVIAYALFVFFPNKRMAVALIGAGILVAFGVIGLDQAFWAVNWNVMGIFIGTLVVADIFMESRVPANLAEIIVERARNTGWAILFICLLTGFISAFVENVATVLIVAPIALSLANKLKINPMNMMIAIAVSSNLQGTATLIGDPPSMLLGSYARMNFNDFFFYHGKPGIFFAVEMGAFFSFFVLYFLFRRHKEKVRIGKIEKVRSWLPTYILIGLIFLLAASSFFDRGFAYSTGLLCMIAGLIALLWKRFYDHQSIVKEIRKLEWETVFFLVGVFILVGSITLTGWIEVVSNSLSGLVGSNILFGYIVIVAVSVLVSAFVDNVPFLVAMLPVAISMSARLGINPSLFLFGLLIGAS
ncbi:MAG: SLC13 family permease, partial [Candidatus Margulisbacteria bacterium]|nr:SLC13 family permease [Candidatus Margulisiibacteriota bacterium]